MTPAEHRHPAPRPAWRSGLAGVSGLLLACVVLVGCGDDSTPSSGSTGATTSRSTTASETDRTPSPSGSAQICADYQELRTSIAALQDVDVVQSGTSGLQAALDEIKADLRDLRSSASGSAADEVQALQESVDDLQAAISDGGVPGILTAAASVVSSGQALVQRLEELGCS